MCFSLCLGFYIQVRFSYAFLQCFAFIIKLTQNLFIFRVVEFASYDDMRNAIDKLDGTELSGRKIKLTEDRKKHR